MYRSFWTTLLVVLLVEPVLFHKTHLGGVGQKDLFISCAPVNNVSQPIFSGINHHPYVSSSAASAVRTDEFNSSSPSSQNQDAVVGLINELVMTSNLHDNPQTEHSFLKTTGVIGKSLNHEPTDLGSNDGFVDQKRNELNIQHFTAKHKRNSASQDYNSDCELVGSRKPALYALRSNSSDTEYTINGSIIIRAQTQTKLFLIGHDLYSNLSVALTAMEGYAMDDCTHTDRIKTLTLRNFSLNIAQVDIQLPSPGANVPYYFCLREHGETTGWFHQGSDPWLRIYVEADFMPAYMKIIAIACLLALSGTFSGLNLGLMSLDKNELQVIMKCGTEAERRYATIIEPVRRRGNYLLCSILFSNTLVNSTISVLLEDLSNGSIAVATSTILIVLFGEILPQAFCSRHGLAVGAKTIKLTNFCMFVTFPLSYPVSWCLDWALGEEIGHAYDRDRLMEFIRVTQKINNLETEEVNIIAGALAIKRVQIREIMTRIEDVYMLDENSILDYTTIKEIIEKGYSRIPIHEIGNRKNIISILFAKDLALLDPDDKIPVLSMTQFYTHPRMVLFEDQTLDKALNEFKTGRSHMAIVMRVVSNDEVDPVYETTGIVTLEDVIEEIMQMEINDETDILTDNRWKRRRKDAQVRRDFAHFSKLGHGDSSLAIVTSQLALAAYQYLTTTVEPFTQKYLSDTVLKKLLSQNIFYSVKMEDDPARRRLYTTGEPADFFIMILEGRVHVVCGKENLVFDGGPFCFFGKAALVQPEEVGSKTPAQEITPSRKVSTAKPALSRRESLAKIALGQLSLTRKSDQIAPVDSETTGRSEELTGKSKEESEFYFRPDYTVDIITQTSYLKVTRQDYLRALKLTIIERGMGGLALDDYLRLDLMERDPEAPLAIDPAP